jgi:hypothetical protein
MITVFRNAFGQAEITKRVVRIPGTCLSAYHCTTEKRKDVAEPVIPRLFSPLSACGGVNRLQKISKTDPAPESEK